MPTPTFPISGIIEQTPDPFQKGSRVRVARNNRKGRVEFLTSKDGGENYRVLLPEPTSKTKVGSILTLQEDGNVDWSAPTALSSLSSVIGNAVVYADLNFAGSLIVNSAFGYYAAPSYAMKCLGVQVFLQTPATGAAVSLDLVSIAGNLAGKVTTLPVATEYIQHLFSKPLSMPATSAWRIKIKQIGSTQPGEFLSVRLILTPA